MSTPVSHSLFSLALRRLCRDRVALSCLAVMLAYLLVIGAAFFGWIAVDWNKSLAVSYAPPSLLPHKYDHSEATISRGSVQEHSVNAAHRAAINQMLDENITDPIGAPFQAALAEAAQTVHTEAPKAATLWFGADRWGRDIIAKTIHGAQTSMMVGLGAALLATLIGTLFGALAGYFGGWVDALFDWLYSLFNSIPYLLLILAIAAVLNSSGVSTMILIFGFTGWTGVYRLIRAETIRQRDREYVRAAKAMGVPHWQRIFYHILPNTNHIILVQISILTVSFIKSEVILSFLGFGVPISEVSWGSMLNEAQNELLLGYWWQLAAATIAMAGLITAWSVFTDALRDALDPKLK